jgi:hypothetical protein
MPRNRSSDQIPAVDRNLNQGTTARKLTLRTPLETKPKQYRGFISPPCGQLERNLGWKLEVYFRFAVRSTTFALCLSRKKEVGQEGKERKKNE